MPGCVIFVITLIQFGWFCFCNAVIWDWNVFWLDGMPFCRQTRNLFHGCVYVLLWNVKFTLIFTLGCNLDFKSMYLKGLAHTFLFTIRCGFPPPTRCLCIRDDQFFGGVLIEDPHGLVCSYRWGDHFFRTLCPKVLPWVQRQVFLQVSFGFNGYKPGRESLQW